MFISLIMHLFLCDIIVTNLEYKKRACAEVSAEGTYKMVAIAVVHITSIQKIDKLKRAHADAD